MRYSISNAIPHNPKSEKHPYENLVKSRLLPFQANKQQPLRSISTAVFLRFNDFTVFCAEVIVKRMGIP